MTFGDDFFPLNDNSSDVSDALHPLCCVHCQCQQIRFIHLVHTFIGNVFGNNTPSLSLRLIGIECSSLIQLDWLLCLSVHVNNSIRQLYFGVFCLVRQFVTHISSLLICMMNSNAKRSEPNSRARTYGCCSNHHLLNECQVKDLEISFYDAFRDNRQFKTVDDEKCLADTLKQHMNHSTLLILRRIRAYGTIWQYHDCVKNLLLGKPATSCGS